mgnify:CR=1 FL=1
MTIAGVAVGGVDPQAASQRVLQVYSSPVEIQYAGSNILIEPSLVGFQLNMDSMLAAADLTRTGASFRGGRATFREIWPCSDGYVSFALRGGPARIPGIVRMVPSSG